MKEAKRFCSSLLLSVGAMFVVLSSTIATNAAQTDQWSVVSPNGTVQVTVTRAAASGQLSYQVEHGAQGQRVVVLKPSPLGVKLLNADLSRDLRFQSAQPQKQIEDSYSMPHGKRQQCRNRAHELILSFQNPAGGLEIDFRAYDNGVTFRYRVLSGPVGGQTLESEMTGFALPQDAKLWCAPSDKAGTYSPAYETYYENEIAAGTPSLTGVGWSFPLLFRTADSNRWALITESSVDEHFCGSRLSSTPTDGVYSVALPNPAEGNGQGTANPSSDLPWKMPWRVVIVGETLGAIVESTLVTDVATPSRITDTSWIRPGRVAWSWWSDNPSPKDAVKQRKFIDLAAEMGWEYVLVDANWTIMDNGNIQDVLRYAKEKGIGVLLWYNSGGPHNVVTEKPRDCFTYEPVRQFELRMLNDWGVKGVKVDFFQSDKQNEIMLYQGIMRDAATQHIMVNFHGCTLPRGWERTYPNLMSMEAVRGEECYIFDSQYPDRAPVQNTILPFTRNAVGPMDYTPVGFSDNRYAHKTSWAHELALSVLFETGWLHFTDRVEAYESLPDAPKQFLKEVPVTWDDARFVAGYPGRYAIVARLKNGTWHLAGINGENQARDEAIRPGSWLSAGRYQLSLIQDGETSRSFKSGTQDFSAPGEFRVKMLPLGGFIATLKPRS